MGVMMDLIHTRDGSPSQSNQSLLNTIIEITNKSRDNYAWVTVSGDHYHENLFRSIQRIYFTAGETISKAFTFKTNDVPVASKFEMNIDYRGYYS